MKKILLCLFALLLLCGCAKTPQSTSAPLAEEAILPKTGYIMSVTPSYETRYYARSMAPILWEDLQQAFCEAYTQVLCAATATNKHTPQGDEYRFKITVSDDGIHRKLLRLVDAGETVYLELTEEKADWCLTYTATKEQAQPLLVYFADEPTGKPHIEGHPNGRMIPLVERVEMNWPIFEGTVTAVSDQVQEYSLNEGLRYGWLYREFTVEVAECYSGDLIKGTKLTYRVFGGETEDYSFSVESAPQVSVGDYVVIAAPEHSFATSHNVFPATAEERTLLGHVYTFYTISPPAGLLPTGSAANAAEHFDAYQLRTLVSHCRTALSEYHKHKLRLPERVTDREVAQLRLSHPRIGSLFSPLASRLYYKDWATAANYFDFDGLVTLDFTGEYLILGGRDDDYAIYEGPVRELPFAVGTCVLFARVEEVLLGCEGVQAGDLVPVLLSQVSDEVFRQNLSGQRFVCFVHTVPSKEEGGNYALSNALQAAASFLYCLTPDDVVLFTGSSTDYAFEHCSGMYLSAFTELIREKLFSD